MDGGGIMMNRSDEEKLYAGSDFYPVAYRVQITGIVVLDSSTLNYPDDDHNGAKEAVAAMDANESLQIRYVRLVDEISPADRGTLIECLLASTHPMSESLLEKLGVAPAYEVDQ